MEICNLWKSGWYVGMLSLFVILLIVPQKQANAAGATVVIKAEEPQ